MKNMTKYALTILSICTVTALFAQSAPPATPIDGGLSILLAGGAAYGLKKIAEHKKNRS